MIRNQKAVFCKILVILFKFLRVDQLISHKPMQHCAMLKINEAIATNTSDISSSLTLYENKFITNISS